MKQKHLSHRRHPNRLNSLKGTTLIAIWTPVFHMLAIFGIHTSMIRCKRGICNKLKYILHYFLKYFWIFTQMAFLLFFCYVFATQKTAKNFSIMVGNMNLLLLRLVTLRRINQIAKYLRFSRVFVNRCHRKYQVLAMRLMCFSILIFGIFNACKIEIYWQFYNQNIFAYYNVATIEKRVESLLRSLFLCYFTNLFCLPIFMLILCCITINLQQKILRNPFKNLRSNKLSVRKLFGFSIGVTKATSIIKSLNDSISPVLFLLISIWIANIFFDINKLFSKDNSTNSFVTSAMIADMVMNSLQLTVLAALANETNAEYEKLLTIFIKNDSEIFRSRSGALLIGPFIRILEELREKITVRPLEMFNLDNKLILTTAGVIVTYSTIMLQIW